jgi:hypothetical protein
MLLMFCFSQKAGEIVKLFLLAFGLVKRCSTFIFSLVDYVYDIVQYAEYVRLMRGCLSRPIYFFPLVGCLAV